MVPYYADKPSIPFSFENDEVWIEPEKQVVCHTTFTKPELKKAILGWLSVVNFMLYLSIILFIFFFCVLRRLVASTFRKRCETQLLFAAIIIIHHRIDWLRLLLNNVFRYIAFKFACDGRSERSSLLSIH